MDEFNNKEKSGFAKLVSDYGRFLREVKAEFADLTEPLWRILFKPRVDTYDRLLRFSLLSHLILSAWLVSAAGLDGSPVLVWVLVPIVIIFLGITAGAAVFTLSYLFWTFGGKNASEVRWPTTGIALYIAWLLPGITPVYGVLFLYSV
jgi:hypothetical protein